MINVKRKYKFAVIAADVVIFTIKNKKLQVLQIKMNKYPFKSMWAMPGGLIRGEESVDDAAKRILHEKTGLKNIFKSRKPQIIEIL